MSAATCSAGLAWCDGSDLCSDPEEVRFQGAPFHRQRRHLNEDAGTDVLSIDWVEGDPEAKVYIGVDIEQALTSDELPEFYEYMARLLHRIGELDAQLVDINADIRDRRSEVTC